MNVAVFKHPGRVVYLTLPAHLAGAPLGRVKTRGETQSTSPLHHEIPKEYDNLINCDFTVWVAVHAIGAIIYAYNIIYAYIVAIYALIYTFKWMFGYIYAYITTIYAYITTIYAYIATLYAYMLIIYAYIIAPMTWTATHITVASKTIHNLLLVILFPENIRIYINLDACLNKR